MDKLKKRIFALEQRIQKRMEQNHKSGGDYIPYSLSDQRKTLNELQDRLGGTGCELFDISLYIAVSTETKEELDDITHYFQNQGVKHQVQIQILTEQQVKGLQAILPFAQHPFTAKSGNNTATPMLSDGAGVLVPFSNVDHFVPGGLLSAIRRILRRY